MEIRVRFFATLRDAAGTDECRVALESGARGVDAKTILVARHPRLAGLVEYARLAIHQEYQPWDTLLRDGDELALIPPVSGG